MLRLLVLFVVVLAIFPTTAAAQAADAATSHSLLLNKQEYFEMPGLNVMAFQDIYPDGHQGGVSIIQNGVRVATNGDLRLDPAPGQWQPMPLQGKRVVNTAENTIVTTLSYPDPSKNRTGFNPIDYPNLNFSYTVRVKGEGASIRITVDLDKPIPEEFIGKVGFNLELYPTDLFGRSWYLGKSSGIFPRQPNGPEIKDANGETQPAPLAMGPKLSIAGENAGQRMLIVSDIGQLQLIDARNKRNNGWFVVRSLVASGASKGAINWLITPHAIPGWQYRPVIHVSQVGYHPLQKKVAILEVDKQDASSAVASLERISEEGSLSTVLTLPPAAWGDFLRFKYLQFDFSSITQPGMYQVAYRGQTSQPFRIAPDVYQHGVWQPVLEYFLPVQMCHMRVEQQYRVWHGMCHMDDARMAPTNHNHFDGYKQGASTLTSFKAGEDIPGLDEGGWHDAGDFDLRIESQADEVSILAAMYEAFDLNYDDTSIDEEKHLTRIHEPDGKPDVLQQVEHGVLTILGGYRSMGRVYRGIQESTLEQYTLLGDQTNVTDNLRFNSSMKPDERSGKESGKPDDRWIFTEENPQNEYRAISALAACGRVLKSYKPALANECTTAATHLWLAEKDPKAAVDQRMIAAAQLWMTTHDPIYRTALLENRAAILAHVDRIGWMVAQVAVSLGDPAFTSDLHAAVSRNFTAMARVQQTDSPFGVPYKPHIWGAGWEIERFGVEQYYLHRAFPDVVTTDYMLNSLNFMLGVHPGENTASFASGVGARSATIAYGFNRADSSYIPGGVVSGTALIRPDFPELKEFPYLWQQTEYVLGGGSTNYMFLVLAADQVLNAK